MLPIMDRHKETDADFSQDTWMSLLGLLRPLEFFVTVDHFPIWRRHLAWAKTDGHDLRMQITQRFSSNMVFMSLMLGSEITVLFNSATITTEMRKSMEINDFHDGKFWIGAVIILSICVTLTALVATFTAWAMVSSISDENMHCVIRSSIGQYVTHLPSRLVVSALYLFMLWVVLFMVNILSGVFKIFCLAFIFFLFFQVVIAYSAFGRLIVHTGAMGKKRILDPELEHALLPSGLHASLLIKATDRMRRRTSVVTQYKSQKPKSSSVTRSSIGSLSTRALSEWDKKSQRSLVRKPSKEKDREKPTKEKKRPTLPRQHRKQQDSLVMDEATERAIHASARHFSPVHFDDLSEDHNTRESIRDSAEPVGPSDSPGSDSSASIDIMSPPNGKPNSRRPLVASAHTLEERGIPDQPESSHDIPDSIKARMRKQLMVRRQSVQIMRAASARHTQHDFEIEWDDEYDVRDIYGAPAPIDLLQDDDDDDEEEDHSEKDMFMPRASILNTSRNWQSLRRLVKNEVDESKEAFGASAASPTSQDESAGLFSPAVNLFRSISGAPGGGKRDSPSKADGLPEKEQARGDSDIENGENQRLLSDSLQTYSAGL